VRLLLAAGIGALLVAAAPGSAAPRAREILFAGGYHGFGSNILAIRENGTGFRVVVQASEGRYATSPRWSLSGGRLVFANGEGLAVVGGAGGSGTQITRGEDAPIGWSPNGRWIAFVRYEGRSSSLYIVGPGGSPLRRLRAATGLGSWAPDSRRLLVPYRGGVGIVDLAGRVRALPHSHCGGSPAWSPNGRWIALTRCLGAPYRTGIAIVRPDGSGFRWLRKTGGDSAPVWSAGSTRLAYTYTRQLDYLEHSEIRMLTLAGKPLGNLDSHAQDHDEYPQWSPDGKRIVFDRDAAVEPIGEADRLYVGDVQTGRVRKLYDGTHRGSQSWRPGAS
jgi:Tol biopolymer transport system component